MAPFISRKFIFFLFFLLVSGLPGRAQNWQPAGERMKTRWAKQVSPENAWREYPRPQLVRAEWQNLNGLWDYAIVKKGSPRPRQFDGKILVPYAVESSLSGVGRALLPDQELWYRTSFAVPASWNKHNSILHFGAVDWQATIYVNGKLAGEHKGGSDAFSLDISKYLKKGQQELVVKVWDPTDTDIQPRGKQILKPHGFWYTAVSGIWQTVWLEPVAPTSIAALVPEADIDRSLVQLKTVLRQPRGRERVRVKVTYKNEVVAEQEWAYQPSLPLQVPNAQLWTPEYPNVYKFRLELLRDGKVLDQVDSYFAMRKISLGKDENGFVKLLLNNQPYFQWGTLDQGWWPDGLLTPPSDEAMKYDLEVVKSMGFNMIRKHIKVEPARYYFHADTLGLLLWQDMPTGFLALGHPEQHVKAEALTDWNRPKESALQFEKEWKSIMDNLRFFPSIVVWVPFNEGWGQYDTKRVVEWTKQYDPTRLVDGVSGWTDRGVGHMNDAHQYPGPSLEPAEQNPGRALVLGEFGGLGYPVQSNLWNPGMRNWGYRTYLTQKDYLDEYTKLIYNVYPLLSRGLAAALYTQTSDVEGEVNGLMTYDREFIKMPPAMARILHQPLYNNAVAKAHFLIRDSELAPAPLMVSFEKPEQDWNKHNPFAPQFKKHTGAVKVKKGQTLWAVNSFVQDEAPEHLAMKIYAQGALKVYLNGHLIHDRQTLTKRHYDELNISQFTRYLKKGKNVIGLELKDAVADSDFDFGLYRY